MGYATLNDIIAIYGKDHLHIADRNNDGKIDEEAVQRALDLASGEIDSYIGVRYPLPLKGSPAPLTQICVDIAIYRLARSHDVLSEEMKSRYEQSVTHLKAISAGRAILVIEKSDSSSNNKGPQPIVTSGPNREFSREKLREV